MVVACYLHWDAAHAVSGDQSVEDEVWDARASCEWRRFIARYTVPWDVLSLTHLVHLVRGDGEPFTRAELLRLRVTGKSSSDTSVK